MNNYLVSVVITTYNVEKYIAETLDSIFNQSYRNIEIQIIDDGSDDNTLNIINSYLKNKSNLYIEPRSHTGNIGKNLNDCIKKANGEIIAILGGDDVWYPKKIELQLRYLNEYDFVCSNKNIIDGESNKVSDGDKLNINEIDLKTLLFRNVVLASSLIGYKNSFILCGLFDEKVGNRSEDYALWLKITEKYKIKYLNEVLLGYRIHGNNLSTKSFSDVSEVLNRNIELISQYLNYDDKSIIAAAQSGIAAIYNRFAIYKFYDCEFKDALKFLKKSFSKFKGEFKLYYLKRILFYLLIQYKLFFRIKKIGFEKRFIRKW